MEKKTKESESNGYLKYAIAAAVVIVIAAGVFVLTQGQGQAQQGGGAFEVFNSSMSKLAGIGQYDLAYSQMMGNVKLDYEVVKGQNGNAVIAKDVVGRAGFYELQDGLYGCVEYKGQSVCAKVTPNSTVEQYYNENFKQMFFDAAGIRKERENVAALVGYGGAVFEQAVVDEKINGIACKKVTYTSDYTKLNVNQLAKLGVQPSDAVVTRFANFKTTLCFDEKSGMPIQTSLAYSDKLSGKNYTYEKEYDKVVVGNVGMVKLAQPPEHTSKYEEVFATYMGERQVYYACENLAPDQKVACYGSIALDRKDTHFCGKIEDRGERESCYLRVAALTFEWPICEKEAAGLKDACLLEIGANSGDISVCERITDNAQMQALCMSAAGNVTKKKPAKDTRDEYTIKQCAVDSDCIPSGCGGMMCTPKNMSLPQFGQCIEKPVYACYQMASCGCKSGQCAWYKGEQYNICVADIERIDVEQYLINITGNKTASQNQTIANATANSTGSR